MQRGIATNNGEGLLCLSVKGDSYGKVIDEECPGTLGAAIPAIPLHVKTADVWTIPQQI